MLLQRTRLLDCAGGTRVREGARQGVANAKLAPADRTTISMFMEIAYKDEISGFKTGLLMAKTAEKEEMVSWAAEKEEMMSWAAERGCNTKY